MNTLVQTLDRHDVFVDYFFWMYTCLLRLYMTAAAVGAS